MLGYVSLWAATVAPLLRHKCVLSEGKEKDMAEAVLFDIMY
jgi:hypothetical protein